MNKVNIKNLVVLLLICFVGGNTGFAQSLKQKVLDRKRQELSENSFRYYDFNRKNIESVEDCISLLDEDGVFKDLRSKEIEARARGLDQSKSSQQAQVGKINVKAFLRLWNISESFRENSIDKNIYDELKQRVFRPFAKKMCRKIL